MSLVAIYRHQLPSLRDILCSTFVLATEFDHKHLFRKAFSCCPSGRILVEYTLLIREEMPQTLRAAAQH